ncbi:hypothetical protein SAMN06297387_111156 [Streptomyces zhaozhouensis]|uniref:Uncharacterized protein n=1 Tax=Streptomyces zhaozhouensis TaxID=1300267 RepID=A0A286DY53_9ACTN|nr:hypothetical protein [Streptomyces zhaozhouensis]SOD63607.1 hypothetical protein SAMN06297387_111156 [Streptomyces zhaozhouensis]
MTSHNGRDDEPREGVVLPPGSGGVTGEAHRDPTPAAPPAGQAWGQHWGPGQGAATPDAPGTFGGAAGAYGAPGGWGDAPPPPASAPPVPPHQPARPPHHPPPPQRPPGAAQQPPQAPPLPAAPQPPQLPPVGSHAMATQATPVVPGRPPAPDEGATELIAPIETTTQLRAVTPPEGRRPGGRHGRPAPQGPPAAPPHQPARPPAADEGATELIPLVTDRFPDENGFPEKNGDRFPNEAATELIAPVTDDTPPPGAAQEAATQLIPPVPADGGGDPESTTRLRAVPPRQPGRHRSPAQPPPPGAGGVEATQTLPPVGGGDFDQLFRSAADRPPPPPERGWGDGAGHGGPPPPASGRRRSPALLVGAVIAGCAVVGLLAGYLLSGGDDDEGDGSGDGVSPEAQVEEPDGADDSAGGAEEDGADPARAQAEALSELLADSNDSRDAVIESVAAIRSCERLDAAADDLRAAADQRTGMVDRLNELTLDELPDNGDLIAALTEAWQASAEADEHYAAWADEARANRGEVCRGGQARHTERAGQGDAASGRATEAKERAAGLWNPLAGQYALPERAATQL